MSLVPRKVVCLVAAVVVTAGVTACSSPGRVPHTPEPTTAGSLGQTSWLTYRQPPGPMRLTFQYPSSWRAAGDTLISSMGNVGQATVIGATPTTFAEFKASRSCIHRADLLHSQGVLISWGENVGSPFPDGLAQRPGRRMTVDGHPAKLDQTTSGDCAASERFINGTISLGGKRLLFMHAEVAGGAPASTLATVRRIFMSARG